MIPTYILHRNPDIFGENPDQFIPERFLNDGMKEQVDNFLFHAFGGGPRICIGMRFVSSNVFFHYLICGNVIECQVTFSFYKITTHPLILVSENCLIFSKFWRGRRSLHPLHGENTSGILYFFRQNNQAMLSCH